MIRIFTLLHSRIMVRIHDIADSINVLRENRDRWRDIVALWVLQITTFRLKSVRNNLLKKKSDIMENSISLFDFMWRQNIYYSKPVINYSKQCYMELNFCFVLYKTLILLIDLRRLQLQSFLIYLFQTGNMVQFIENNTTCSNCEFKFSNKHIFGKLMIPFSKKLDISYDNSCYPKIAT